MWDDLLYAEDVVLFFGSSETLRPDYCSRYRDWEHECGSVRSGCDVCIQRCRLAPEARPEVKLPCPFVRLEKFKVLHHITGTSFIANRSQAYCVKNMRKGLTEYNWMVS